MQLAKSSGELPRSLFLNDADIDAHHSIHHAGGFSDISIGTYEQHTVALKVLRVFTSMDEKTRKELTQVRDFIVHGQRRELSMAIA